MQHEAVPVGARLDAYPRGRAVFAQDLDALAGQGDQGLLRVAGQQQVAPATQHHRAAELRPGQQRGQRFGIVDLGEQARGRGHAEAVAPLQGHIPEDAEGQAHASGGSAPRLGAKRRRRIASTHSPTRAGPR